MLAVIKTGGKQYIIKEGTVLKVEKFPGKVWERVAFDQVLLVADEKPVQTSAEQKFPSGRGDVKVGTPTVAGAKVEAEILEQGRTPKVTIIKYKRKVRYKRKRGHRQFFTKVKIVRIAA